MHSNRQHHPIASDSEDDLYLALGSRPTGLSTVEANNRVTQRHAPDPERNIVFQEARLFLRQFRNPLILLLLAAVLLAAFLGETSDTLIILSILLITSMVGFLQERSAIRAAAKLRQLTRVHHTVLRDGAPREIGPESIVHGDVLSFQAGDIIPADCRLLDSNEPLGPWR